MTKFRVSIRIKDKLFSSNAEDVYEAMELIGILAEKPLSPDEELATLKDLARMEHKDEVVDMSIAGRPISVTSHPDKLKPPAYVPYGCPM